MMDLLDDFDSQFHAIFQGMLIKLFLDILKF